MLYYNFVLKTTPLQNFGIENDFMAYLNINKQFIQAHLS